MVNWSNGEIAPIVNCIFEGPLLLVAKNQTIYHYQLPPENVMKGDVSNTCIYPIWKYLKKKNHNRRVSDAYSCLFFDI